MGFLLTKNAQSHQYGLNFEHHLKWTRYQIKCLVGKIARRNNLEERTNKLYSSICVNNENLLTRVKRGGRHITLQPTHVMYNSCCSFTATATLQRFLYVIFMSSTWYSLLMKPSQEIGLYLWKYAPSRRLYPMSWPVQWSRKQMLSSEEKEENIYSIKYKSNEEPGNHYFNHFDCIIRTSYPSEI